MPYSMLCFTTRRPDLSFEQYKDYYENKHAPLIMRVTGRWAPEGYTRYYLDRSAKENDIASPWILGSPSSFEYDACTVITWRDKAACDEAGKIIANQEVWQEVIEDEEKFLDRSKTVLVTVGEGHGPQFLLGT